MANTNDYGVWGLAHLYAQKVSQAGVQRVWDEVLTVATEYNRVFDELMDEWVQRTTIGQEQVELAGTGTLQPIDEYGNPLPVKPSGKYQVGYPIQGGATAWGNTRVTRALMTVNDVQRNTFDAFRRDKDWMIRHILAALFTNTSWTFIDEVPQGDSAGLGSITIQPLANSDTVTYGRKGFGAAATDTHYLAQASAIADATNPYPTIRAELLEHPSNGNGTVTAYIASDLVATTKALANFDPVARPTIQYGANTDLAVGSEFNDTGVGDYVLGEVDGVRIVEWASLPSTYIIAKVDGVAPLAMREYPDEALQGFFPEMHSPDGNRMEMRWIRYAGFGVRNRVSAVVVRIGNGSYAIPSGFSAPLAV